MYFPKFLASKLNQRKEDNALRSLSLSNSLIDFSSNDYLGFAKSKVIFDKTHQYLLDKNLKINGATGSRLLSGNHELYLETENFIASFHQSETALIFNSGYDANIGFFSCIPQRNDIILFDELCHASIRDGIKMSNAKSYKFQHNDSEDLEKLLNLYNAERSRGNSKNEIYIVTESVFSMDGDSPNMQELVNLSEKYNCYLVVDEAHALGVFGSNGEGFIKQLQLQDRIFARIMTFGKGLGCHGATILGSSDLRNYLVNFSRSFIYTTGLSPHSVATILVAYRELENGKESIQKLNHNILFFNQQISQLSLKPLFVSGKAAIQSVIFSGNDKVKSISNEFQKKGFDVKPILSPTVPEGQERLRFCLHSYNSEEEISEVLNLLAKFIFKS
ncbi:MAG: pyridoxal phosphate-dependent aminotransferase family protein [Flavobacterium sp.]|nr:pyridoxal phosphate-dependent aminotransferase family protein [Flavobacterium sp.]